MKPGDYCRSRRAPPRREKLNDKIEADYFSSMAYYKMSFVDKRVDQPHNRIVKDVPAFCDELGDIVLQWLKVCTCILAVYVNGEFP